MGSYIIKDAASGGKTLVYRNGAEIRLHSAYDPDREAGRSVSAFDKGRRTIIVVSGIALAYHIKHLKNKYPGTRIVAVEHDREAIDAARETFPHHLEGVQVITSHAGLEALFEEASMSTFKGVSHYIHRPSYALHPGFYDEIYQDINRFFTSKISDLLTRFEFEQKWIENILENIPRTFSSGQVKDLFGKFRGYPGIIVSAGPSLRKNIDVLNEFRDRALVVCVDTALAVLKKKNITPHIVMTLDAQKHSIKHFSGYENPSVLLLADLVSYPAIARSYSGPVMFSTTSKFHTDLTGTVKRETTPLIDWLEKYIPSPGDVQSGGSVATSAFDLLLNLGCDPILLVGQDLAYTGREIHCSGTHHNDDWLPITTRTRNLDSINQNVIRKRKIKHVEAVGGLGTVISDFVFDLYRGWFEDSARKVPVKVINATEGGARIKNSIEESLESLKNRFPTKKPAPGVILQNSLKKRKAGDPGALFSALGEFIGIIREIQTRAGKALEEENMEEAVLLQERIDECDLGSVFSPFLKKTEIYITRHKLDKNRASKILLQDMALASKKISALFSKCRGKLEQYI